MNEHGWIRHSFPGYNGGEMNLWECPECHAVVWEQLFVNRDPANGARALHDQWHAREGKSPE